MTRVLPAHVVAAALAIGIACANAARPGPGLTVALLACCSSSTSSSGSSTSSTSTASAAAGSSGGGSTAAGCDPASLATAKGGELTIATSEPVYEPCLLIPVHGEMQHVAEVVHSVAALLEL